MDHMMRVPAIMIRLDIFFRGIAYSVSTLKIRIYTGISHPLPFLIAYFATDRQILAANLAFMVISTSITIPVTFLKRIQLKNVTPENQ